MTKTLGGLALALLMSACATPGPRYHAAFMGVERAQEAQQRWGQSSFSDENATFEDGLIRATVAIGPGTVNLRIANKTAEFIRVVWDQAAFVANGTSTAVVNGETRFANVGQPQTPTVIPPNAAVGVVAIPRNRIGTNYVEDFVPVGMELTKNVSAKLILPLEVGDSIHRYTFDFELTPPPGK